MPIDDLFVSRFLNKLETWASVTFPITKLLIEDDEIYCVGFSLLLSILLAKFGPTLIKCLLNWSAISSLLVYILLFLAILRGSSLAFCFSLYQLLIPRQFSFWCMFFDNQFNCINSEGCYFMQIIALFSYRIPVNCMNTETHKGLKPA